MPVHAAVGDFVVGRHCALGKFVGFDMSKRLFWIFVALCCIAAVTLLFVQSRVPGSSQQDAAGQPSEVSAEISTETPQADLPPAQSSSASAAIETGDDTRSPVAASTPAAQKQTPHFTQSAARTSQQPLPTRQPQVESSQDAKRQAEVWSYPPLLQQNASNNFVRAMENLANAKTESDRYRALGDAAKSDFIYGKIEDARNYASELLSLDEKFKGEPWRDGSAVYNANLVLGRIAAEEGRMDEAKQHLLESGKSTGSPVLRSFGPNMSLARDLLQSGERAAVLEFFELCGKFWTTGNETLTLWSEDVRAGRMPDFGANLLY